MKTTLQLTGNPKFILESKVLGEFYLLNHLTFDTQKHTEWGWDYEETNKGIIVLRKGMDILEVPNRNVSILVKKNRF